MLNIQRTKIMLLQIYGKMYNIENFIYSHPGDVRVFESMLQCDDITLLVESYHSFGRKHVQDILQKYEVHVDINNRSHTDIISTCIFTINDGGFYETCKSRVYE